MTFSSNTLQIAKQFGPAILSGEIFNNPAQLEELYAKFLNKKKEEITDFVDYIGNFLNPSQLFHLVESLVRLEGTKLGQGTLRTTNTLGKYLFYYEVKKYFDFKPLISRLKSDELDPTQIHPLINLPETARKHYKSILLPLFANVDKNKEAADVTNHALFNMFNSIVMDLLSKDTAISAGELQFYTGVFKDILGNPLNFLSQQQQEMRASVFNSIENSDISTPTAGTDSTAFEKEKFNKITDALLKLRATKSEPKFEELVQNHFKSVLDAQDSAILAFVLKKFESTSAVSSVRPQSGVLNTVVPAAAAPEPKIKGPTGFRKISSTEKSKLELVYDPELKRQVYGFRPPSPEHLTNPEVKISGPHSFQQATFDLTDFPIGIDDKKALEVYLASFARIKLLIKEGVEDFNSKLDLESPLYGKDQYTFLREALSTNNNNLQMPAKGLISMMGVLELAIQDFKSQLPAENKLYEVLSDKLNEALGVITDFRADCMGDYKAPYQRL